MPVDRGERAKIAMLCELVAQLKEFNAKLEVSIARLYSDIAPTSPDGSPSIFSVPSDEVDEEE
jgi:hypothetical protein